jgi:hypothetical protein
LRETAPIANMSRSLPTTLAAQAHRAEGQCLLEGQTPNNGKSLRFLGGTRRQTFSKSEAQDLGHDSPKKKNVRQGDVFFYVKNVDLIPLRQKYNYKVHEGKNYRNGHKVLLDALKLVGIGTPDRIPNY